MKSIDYNEMVISENHNEGYNTEDDFGLKKNGNILRRLEQKYLKPIFEKKNLKDSKGHSNEV
jgi:hypothetical protein